MHIRILAVLALALCMGACERSAQPGEVASSAGMGCAALAQLAVADTTVTVAEEVAAGRFTAPTPPPFGAPPDFSALPAFCRVAGSIAPTADSDIQFELWLPLEGWNGRFMQTGNGGAAGAIVYGGLGMALARGYAVANTDTGHRGGGGEFTWAVGHPERLVDYQYRAVRELTRVGKALTAAHYGRDADKSYWLGCSTGGRQGLKEVQRFPQDYDAVIAGAPANNWSPLVSLSVLIERELGPQGLPVEKLGALRDAAVAACDEDDGVKDGVIAEPASCAFDPASLACEAEPRQDCLTDTQVAAARRIYAGVVAADGTTVMPGTGPGSELEWAGYASAGFRIGSSYYQNVIFGGTEWDPASFEVDRDLARSEAFDQGAAKAMDPQIGEFIARGGKLLLYHGTTDGLIPYRNSITYFESVAATLGEDALADSVKLYLVPGMNHCAGGSGAYQVDWLTAMEAWLEQGRTPGALPAVHPGEADGFSRPVCPYPQTARYTGSGDNADAASYRCVAL